ncbi:MAG TPA: pilus assembly protein TadG-related protein [Gaiellaceae bacterium]|jgi:Flp pilus assembly protein TadG
MTKRLRNESGQAVLMTVLFLAVLIGAAALTTDVGGWYRQQRQAQATADAAALAGAQALPASDTTQAQTLAAQYGASNGGGVDGVSFSTGFENNDTVTVSVQKSAPSFFAGVFSIDHATVTATASARAGVPNQVQGLAPIAVDKNHPFLTGPGCPCFDVDTTLCLGKACTGLPSGAFGMVDLNGGSNGTPELADWIENGYSGYLPLGQYQSDPGAKFNAGPVQSALSDRLGTDLLFPVYDGTGGGGAGGYYNVIGWVGFHLTGLPGHGSSAELEGYFTKVIWNGLQGTTDQNLPDFGVYSVELVN